MKQFLLVFGLLCSFETILSSYTVGGLDSISGTDNGGTGFGNATQASAVGYVIPGFTNNMQLNGSAMQPDGKIVIVGEDVTTGDAIIARYNINGTEDTTFNSGFYVVNKFGATSAIARAVTALPNGKIVVVGSVVDTTTQFFIAQYLPNGSLDTSFGGADGFAYQNVTAGATDIAYAVAVDTSGNIYVAGTSTQTALGNVFIARYTSAGVLDTTYNSTGVVSGGGAGATVAGIALVSITTTSLAGYGLALDASGKSVVVGASASALLIARLTAGTGASSGILDTSFNTTGYNTQGSAPTIGYAVGFQSTGKIIVAGIDTPNALVLRYTTSGLLDSYANNPGSPFGTGGAGSQTGYITSIFGGTAAIARGLAIQSDDTIVIGGNATISANQSLLIARYLADGSALDTGNFGQTASNGYTATYIASADNGNTLSMQENGSFILAGYYDNSTTTNFITARYLGDIPQGCMDLSYNPSVATSPGAPGYRTYPTDATPTNKPKVTAMYPAASGTLYALTSATGSTNSQLVKLNSNGSTASAAVVIAKPTPNDVITDSQNRAVVVGTGATNGFIARYTSTGAMTIDSTFNSGAVVEVTDAISLVKVCEQNSNRLVAIGQLDSITGIVIGYTENGEIDFSFGSGYGYITEGGNATFNDMIIDANNGIYIAYQVAAGNIFIEKLSSNGAALDESFATGSLGQADTGLVSASYTTPCLSFDNSGNIVLSVVEISTSDIKILVYPPTGTGAAPTPSTISQTTTLLSTPVITKLQCDTNNRLIFTGYDANDFFVGRCGSGVYTLDTTFAPYSSSPGLLKTMYSTNNPSRVSNSVCINSNGAILFGGYENIDGSNTVSTVGQVVGNIGGTVYTQVNRYPGIDVDDVGTLDTTFGNNGAFNLATSSGVPDGQAKVMNVLATNKILMTSANGTDTVLARLTSGYALDTSFSTDGLVTLTGIVTPTAIMVDTTAANYYVLGVNATPLAVINKVVASDGSLAGGAFPVTTTLTSAYAIAQQASGRILVAGYDSAYAGGASGVIAAYTPAGALDTSFNPSGATPGYWYTSVASPIMAISIGTISTQLDRIYLAYSDGGAAALGNAVVQQLLENGTAYAPTSGTGLFTPITAGFSNTVNGNTQLRMQLDVNGKIVIAAATASTYGTTPAIKAARYPAAGGTLDVGPVSVLTGTANQVIENILTLSDGTTLILAAVPNATAASAFMSVAQLNSSFVLDPTFNTLGTPGYLTTNVPSSASTPVMENFYAIDVLSDGGILVSGDNSETAATADPYLAKIYAIATPTKVSQSATSLGAAGTLDTTYNPAGTTAGFVNFAAELGTTQFPSATTITSFMQRSNGTYYVGGNTSSNSYVTLMSDDDVQNASFGSSGLLTISSQLNLSTILLAQSGALLVAGGAGGSGTNLGWLKSYNASTGAATAGFTVSDVLDGHFAGAQQSTGRIIVAGIEDGVGTLIAYNSVTGAVDTTFASSGRYTATGFTGINGVIVDALDNIYFIANSSGNAATVKKLSPSGTSVTWTGSTTVANSTLAANNQIAFDQAGNIVIAVVDTTTPQIVVRRYASSNGVESATINLAVGTTGVTTPNVTDILIDLNTSPGKIILTGYDTNTSPNTPFLMRILSNLSGLDTSFNTGGSNPGVQSYNTLTSGVTTNWYAGMINADGKITVGGYASVLTTPYTMRVYGDEFIGQFSPSTATPASATPGTINTNFGASGMVDLGALGAGTPLAGLTPQVVLPSSVGQYYIACTNGTLARLTNGAVLDTSYGGGDGIAASTSTGVYAMILDSSSRLVLTGTNGGTGFISRYVSGNSGALDTTFSGDGQLTIPSATVATQVVQQTLSRYVVAGQLASNGALFGITDTGTVDTTFGVSGIYDSGVASTPIYALITDIYDRLIIAYKVGSNINLRRLTSSGQLDTSFGTSGTIPTIFSNVDDATQVFLTFDVNGNIVVAAHTSTPSIMVAAYANGAGTVVVENPCTISTIITNTPVMTDLITTADGKVLLAGYQSGTNSMWVARVVDNGSGAGAGTYGLDTAFGGGDGIMTFSFDGAANPRVLNSIAIYPTGEIAMVGTETNGTVNPFLSMAYDTPYTSQTIDFQGGKPVGTNDTTLGASTTTATNLGVTFFGSSGANAASGQVATAIALQDDNNIVIAMNGGAAAGTPTPSQIFLTMFDIDGVVNTTFGTAGQATVLTAYNNQYVQDMVTFTTVAGVNKAILAGYVTNTALSSTSSLLLQYNLDTAALDTTFGGFNGNPQGIAFGDGKQINAVAQQTSGRIIAAGISQDTLGLLLGYTSNGKLDDSFGNDGYLAIDTASTGLYTHAIDSLNRVIVAYNSGSTTVAVARYLADGSGLDTSFTAVSLTTTLSGNSNIRIGLDSSDNVIVGACTNGTGNELRFKRYSVTNGNQLQEGIIPYNLVGGLSSADYNFGQLIVDADNNVVAVLYDENAKKILVVRLVIDGVNYIKDSTFNAFDATTNPSGVVGGGYLLYAVAGGTSSQAAYDALIHPDGRIIVVGSES